MAFNKTDFISCVVALLLSILILAETIVVVFVTLDLTDNGPYSNLQRTAYVTVSTIIASAITAFITSNIRRLWTAVIDQHFQHGFCQGVLDYNYIQGKWSSVLAVGSISETVRFWRLQLTFFAAALITTSVVASLNPTLATKTVAHNAQVSTGLPWQCAVMQNFSDTRYSVYEWPLSNGSYLCTGGNWGGCPSRRALTLMGGINVLDPNTYAYSDLGVAVKLTAIGAPVSVFGLDPLSGIGRTFTDFLSISRSNVVNITQCVRVLVSNPVSCHIGGTVNYTSGRTGPVTVYSDDKVCSFGSLNNVTNPETSSIMVKGTCATGDPGQATIVLGATNKYARWLALAINYPDRPSEDNNVPLGYTFAVTCHIDTRTAFAYREVTLSLQDASQTRNTSLGRQLNGGDVNCRNFDPLQNLGLLGTAVSANWQPLEQNDGFDGWFDSINQMTIDSSGQQSRLPPYAFPHSQNALEDTLGLVIGLVVARLNGIMEHIPAPAAIIHTRVGSGKLIGLFYAIPPLIVVIILTVLLIRTWQPVKGDFSSINLENLSRVNYKENRLRPSSVVQHHEE